MRKQILSLLIIIALFAVVGLCLTACSNEEEELLATPKSIAITNGVVSWKMVTGADSYELRVNGEIVETTELSYNILEMENLPSNGEFTVRVRAAYNDDRSEWSDILTYKHVATAMRAPTFKVANGKLTWTANNLAAKVVITVNDVKTELSKTTEEYNLSALKQDSVISVQFIGDGVYTLDGAIATVVYNAGTGNVSLGAPQNVRMDGYTLTFDAVSGADIYYLQDVTGVVTTQTTTRSDITSKYFVKAVWAGNTKGEFENSAPASVEYFTEGSGTAEDPFLISTPQHLRYIDYYESTNQSMNYKFKNDIALVAYAPEEEEEYKNFYNLGSLSGVIDGNGYKLSNLTVYFRDGYSSLFDSITPDGAIKNLVIDNANFRTWTNITNDGVMHEKGGECAVLAYTNRGTLTNITVVDSYIYAVKDGASALVSINKGTISNCIVESSNTIYGANEAGAMAIFNSGKITDCINRADISGNTTIGGIVGRNNGIVTRCGNEGNISANTYAGGIVGYNYNIFDEELLFESTISQCYNYGNVSVVSCGGGIAGKNGGNGINEVGVVSPANAGIISCYNTGAISGAVSVGGIVGDNFGYHEAEADLGVINCYSVGSLSVDVNKLTATRIYLDIEDFTWATEEGWSVYMYYWGVAEGVSWPGVRMTEIEIGGKTYYYADANMIAEQLTGVIFTRFSATGDNLDQTEDIVGRVTTGNMLFVMDDSWISATAKSSAELVNNTPITAGGIAGTNTMINDCYYLASEVNGEALLAGAAFGEQTNKIFINGEEAQSSDCEITSETLSTLAETLNAYANVWQNSDNGPMLKWQSEVNNEE